MLPTGCPRPRQCGRFLDAAGDRELLSDEPAFDSYWLDQLAKAAGVSLGDRVLRDAKQRIREAGGDPDARTGSEVRHRAEPDARRLAQLYSRALGFESEPR